MQKLDPKTDGASANIIDENLAKLRELFPDAFTESSAEGEPRWKVDFDALREVLGDAIEDKPERYSFTWNGKSRAKMIANTPTTATLRPCPEESVNWDTTKNLFIEGDNLEVLKLLQKSYHRKVKMIYIDPPYNTGGEFIYPDRFKDNLNTYLRYSGQVDDEGFKLSANTESSGRYHTNWLNMMLPRLRLARHLLRDDGFVFISIDDHEVANLRLLCNEIFGEENFIESLVWKKKYGGGAKTKYYVGLHEYILCYAKSKDQISRIETPYENKHRKYYKYTDINEATRGPYRLQPLNTNSNDPRPNLRYPLVHEGNEVWPESQWQWSKERTERAQENGELVFSETKNGFTVNFKQYLLDEEGNERTSKPFSIIDGIYTQHGTNEIKEHFGDGKTFSFPKPSTLIREIQKIFFDTDYLVLDFFAGSCATAESVLRLNAEDGGKRRFIMVQLPEPCGADSVAYKQDMQTIADIGKERIRRAISKIENERKCENANSGRHLPGMEKVESLPDEGFKVFKLESSSVQPWEAEFDTVEKSLIDSIDKIKHDRTESDVLYELLLKYGLDLTEPIDEREIAGSTVYSVGSGALIVCLAKTIGLDIVEGIVALKEELKPEVMRVVFRDSGFKDDVVKANAVQILKQAGLADEQIRSL